MSDVFTKIKDGLFKTRKSIADSFSYLWQSFTHADDDFYDELEESLILADMGMSSAEAIIAELKAYAKANKLTDTAALRAELVNIISRMVDIPSGDIEFPAVLLVIGVNGVGKTTAIGKLAALFRSMGKSVTLAAGDTFRAAAGEQLQIWGERADAHVVKYADDGADPAAVVFDAISSVKAKSTDVLICDTAGRLHNKKNLMNELEKINRVIDREYPQARKYTFIVIDATTGQNGLMQARTFSETVHTDGLILTKLDGTAKGGIVVAIANELKLPIWYVGVGEGIDDLQPFDAQAFAQNLF